MVKNRPASRTLLLLLLALLLLATGWQLLRDSFSAEEKQVRSQIREALSQKYPEHAKRAAARYRLEPFPGNKETPEGVVPVVLVHGLDDPGKVWMNLAPHLAQRGYPVWIMNYPDDQAIGESARLFRQELAQLHAQGISEINIVAHSMGGLVSRDMLTRQMLPDAGRLPQVSKLIMVGTPNHGSELARFRLFSELRDHAVDLFNGRLEWMAWSFDGAGEAGIDLIPGSRFLRQLNARPQPAETRMVVIAAVLNKIDQGRLLSTSDNTHQSLQALIKAMQKIIDNVGDGLVTLESARLPGAEIYVVEGNHLSMIRNVSASSQRVPPAIPLIVQQLQHPN